jgi:4-azaleucine resistance transporter AzlC
MADKIPYFVRVFFIWSGILFMFSRLGQLDTGLWRQAFSLSIPVAMGYLPAGIAFGVLFVAAKLPIWAAIFSSVVFYAGAGQYASIPLLSGGVGIATISSNILAINLRHAFYAIPLLKQLPTHTLAKFYCLFALTDETFSVLTTLAPEKRQALMLPISLLNHSYWITGTVLGLLIGAGLNDLVPHLDFALVCLFAILAYEQFKVIKAYYPIMIAMLAFIMAMIFTPNWLLLAAICFSLGLIVVYFYLPKKHGGNG